MLQMVSHARMCEKCRSVKEAVEALREVLACEPGETDIRIPYYTIQVDREDWWRAQDIIDKYPGE